MQKDTISRRQLMATAFAGVFSPATRLLPGVPARIAGRAAWLSPVAALPVMIAYVCFLRAVTVPAQSRGGLCAVVERSLGRIPGRAVLAVFGVWIVFYQAFILRMAAERLAAVVYEDSGVGIFMTVTAAAVSAAACGRLRSLSRTAEVLTPLLLAGVLITLVFSAGGIKAENLLPVTAADAPGILYGAVPVIDVMALLAYFEFLTDGVRPGGDDKREFIRWTSLGAAAVFLAGVCVIGALSAPLAGKLENAYFVMVRNIKILNAVERIEVVTVGMWTAADLIFLAALAQISGEFFRAAAGASGRRTFSALSCAAALGGAFLIAGDSFALRRLGERFVPACNLILVFAALPAIFAIGRLRRKI